MLWNVYACNATTRLSSTKTTTITIVGLYSLVIEESIQGKQLLTKKKKSTNRGIIVHAGHKKEGKRKQDQVPK